MNTNETKTAIDCVNSFARLTAEMLDVLHPHMSSGNKQAIVGEMVCDYVKEHYPELSELIAKAIANLPKSDANRNELACIFIPEVESFINSITALSKTPESFNKGDLDKLGRAFISTLVNLAGV